MPLLFFLLASITLSCLGVVYRLCRVYLLQLFIGLLTGTAYFQCSLDGEPRFSQQPGSYVVVHAASYNSVPLAFHPADAHICMPAFVAYSKVSVNCFTVFLLTRVE